MCWLFNMLTIWLFLVNDQEKTQMSWQFWVDCLFNTLQRSVSSAQRSYLGQSSKHKYSCSEKVRGGERELCLQLESMIHGLGLTNTHIKTHNDYTQPGPTSRSVEKSRERTCATWAMSRFHANEAELSFTPHRDSPSDRMGALAPQTSS